MKLNKIHCYSAYHYSVSLVPYKQHKSNKLKPPLFFETKSLNSFRIPSYTVQDVPNERSKLERKDNKQIVLFFVFIEVL